MKKNDILIEAQKEITHISSPPKFKAMKKNSIYTRDRILGFK